MGPCHAFFISRDFSFAPILDFLTITSEVFNHDSFFVALFCFVLFLFCKKSFPVHFGGKNEPTAFRAPFAK